jgi:hypothetical protein
MLPRDSQLAPLRERVGKERAQDAQCGVAGENLLSLTKARKTLARMKFARAFDFSRRWIFPCSHVMTSGTFGVWPRRRGTLEAS